MSDAEKSVQIVHVKPRSFRASLLSVVAMLALAGSIAFFGVMWLGAKGCQATGEALTGVAEALQPEFITESFIEWNRLDVDGTEGNILEVATATADEKFSKKTRLKWGIDWGGITTEISEIVVPATYRYHIDLSDDWFLTSDGERVMVVAPNLCPSLPVAFDTARMKKRSQSGLVRFDGGTQMRDLEKTISTELALRSASEETLDDVREESRIAVAKFIRDWLLSREHWNEMTFTEIAVLFESETRGDDRVTLSEQPATLRLGQKDPEIKYEPDPEVTLGADAAPTQ